MTGGSLSGNEAFEHECEGTCPAFGAGLAVYDGSAELTHVSVTGNVVHGYGGGISNGYSSEMIVRETDISGNTAFIADSYDRGGSGGGVFSYGLLTVESTTVSTNTADFNGGGIAACDSDSISILNSSVSGNSSSTGGGISIDSCDPETGPFCRRAPNSTTQRSRATRPTTPAVESRTSPPRSGLTTR